MIQFNNKPPKKLVVKNLKSKPKFSEEYEASALARISSTIDSVFRDEVLPYGHEEIYRSCETLCKFHLAGSVYRTIYEKCELEAKKSAEKLIKECNEIIDEVEYLKKFEDEWKSFQKHYNLLESLFLYLDKVYINQQQSQSNLVHIKRFGINFFRSFSLKNFDELIEKLMILIERIRRERICDDNCGTVSSTIVTTSSTGTGATNATGTSNTTSSATSTLSLVRNIVEMIRELEEYSHEFEKVFIQRTWTFYERESEKEIKTLNLTEYLQFACNRIIYESETISSLLAPITRDKLMKCVRERLILDQMGNLFPKPMGSSLKFLSQDMGSLKLLYEMVNGVFEVERFSSEFSAFIKSTGQEIMGKGNDYRTIERIAKFKEEVDFIIKTCFQSDPVIQGTLKDAFESVMNGRGERSAELLALYIHQKMKTVSSDIDDVLSISLLLFRYLHCKEAFDSFYKRTLAQRLLFGGVKDLSIERKFITKLREECGGGFVSRMESMLKDVEQSQEMTRIFKSSDAKGITSVSNITVISGLWPNSSNPTGTTGTTGNTPFNTTGSTTGLPMPAEILKLEGSFSQFYNDQKKNCSLKWTENFGSCVMRSNFKSGRYTLNLTIPQSLVLLKFNNEDQITFTKLLKETQMDQQLLEETLKSLCTPIYPILLKDPNNDQFKINEDFEFKDSVKVPLYALQSPFLPVEEEIIGSFKEDEKSVNIPTTSTVTSVILDRQYQVDSLLVRRMKHQTRSLRKDLINYALANLGNVRVSSNDVDERIKGLIEKEFIKLEDDEETLTYLP